MTYGPPIWWKITMVAWLIAVYFLYYPIKL